MVGYTSDVYGKKDKFSSYSVYAGRVYKNGKTPEIASVGIEYLWQNPLIAAKKDPAWFEIIIRGMKKLEV